MQAIFATQQTVDQQRLTARMMETGMDNLLFILRQLGDPEVECRRRNFLCTRDDCGKIDAVVRYLERMFAREEAGMQAEGYPECGRHAEAHRAFLRRLRELQRVRTCGRLEQDALANRIREWAEAHRRDEDEALVSWVETVRPA